MKMKSIVAFALAFATAFAYANGDGKEPEKPNHECQGNSCNGAGPVDIKNLASNWSKMDNRLRQEQYAKLTADQKQELKVALSVGIDVTNTFGDLTASSSSAVTGNTTTYESFSRNLSLASALSPDVKGEVKMGEWSKCGPRYVLPKDKDGKELPPENFVNHSHIPWLLGVLKEKDRVNTIVGPLPVFNTAEPVKEVRYKLGTVMAQRLKSEEGYFLYGHKAMIVGAVVAHSGASNVAGQKGSSGDTLGLGNSGGSGIPQVGAVIGECLLDSGVVKSVTEPAPTPPTGKTDEPKTTVNVEDLVAEIAAKLALRQKLSAPTYRKEWVPCPQPKGCDAPKKGFYRYVPTEQSIEASTELTSTGKGKVNPEVKDTKKSDKGAFISGPDIRRLAEIAAAKKRQ